jgi:short-subunit dehydrogenase
MSAIGVLETLPGAHGVVLTGATGGIGRAIAFALAAQGHALLLVGRQESALHALQNAIKQAHPGVRVDVAVVDLLSAAGVSVLQGRVAADPVLRVLVNNAGTSEFHAFETQATAQLEHVLRTNLLAPMLLTQGMMRALMGRSGAQIINMGSVFGDIGYPGFAAYCASKFGLRGFTQALRRELSASGIRVRYFAPRATRTALNSRAVVAMNTELKTVSDTPEHVASAFVDFFNSQRNEQVLGWPERLFVFINRLRYSITDDAIGKQLPVIEKHMPR